SFIVEKYDEKSRVSNDFTCQRHSNHTISTKMKLFAVSFLMFLLFFMTHAIDTKSRKVFSTNETIGNVPEMRNTNSSTPPIVSSTSANEITPNRLTAFLDDEELVIAGRDSF